MKKFCAIILAVTMTVSMSLLVSCKSSKEEKPAVRYYNPWLELLDLQENSKEEAEEAKATINRAGDKLSSYEADEALLYGDYDSLKKDFDESLKDLYSIEKYNFSQI